MSRFNFNPIRPEHGGDSPDILQMGQPEPISVRICRYFHAGVWVSALVRTWKPDEVKRCRLCPKGRCTATEGMCFLMVNQHVSDEDAPLFSTCGMVRQNGF